MVDFARMSRQKALKGPRCVVDFETRSEADLKDKKKACGAWVYSQHPSTRILCFSYAIGDQPTKIWRAWHGDPFPEDLKQAAASGMLFEAHNAGFELAIWTNVLEPQFGIPLPKHWACTMAACAYRALPMGLDDVGRVLKLTIQKDKRGKYLLDKLSKPQKLTKKDIKEGKTYPNFCDDASLMEELYAYCIRDTESERELGAKLRDLPPEEYEVWCLDRTINERGVFVDVEALRAATVIRDDVFEKLLKELPILTDGKVTTANQNERIIEWAAGFSIYMDDMTADRVDDKVKQLRKTLKEGADLYPDDEVAGMRKVLRVLEIRQTLSKTSTNKIGTMLRWLPKDKRVRGLLQYHGAATGRFAGRGPQPQNFPRPDEALMFDTITRSPTGKKMNHHDGMEKLMDIVRTGDAELLELCYGDPMEAMASALRGFIRAEPGNELYVGDFSAIEARVLAWLAGEKWKLDAFAAIDRGEGYHGSEDIYLATASTIFGYPCLTKDSHKKERGTGKVAELSAGYQGSVGAWRKFDDSDKYTDEEVNEIITKWRDSHPMTKKYWYGLEAAALAAVQMQKSAFYRDITYAYVKSEVVPWLACRLPNGKCLWYYNPQADVTGLNPFTGEPRYQISYEGRDNKKGGAWGRVRSYGGMMAENTVSAVSRELMVAAMFRVEAKGYPLVLTIHDELVAERKKNTGGSIEEFNALMVEPPPFVANHELHLPIAVDGWCGPIYKKG